MQKALIADMGVVLFTWYADKVDSPSSTSTVHAT